MSLASTLRRRWGRWVGLLAVVCAAVYGTERFRNEAKPKGLADLTDIPEPELSSTLAGAQELPVASQAPLAAPSKVNWDPQPEWRFEMTGSLKDRSRMSAEAISSAPIPEAFPLQPRFKKGPPVTGNAIADPMASFRNSPSHEPILQPANAQNLANTTNINGNNAIQNPSTAPSRRTTISSTAVTTFSPFSSVAESQVNSSISQNVVSNSIDSSPPRAEIKMDPSVLAIGSSKPSEAWPDQAFVPPAPIATSTAESLLPPSAPHLLTNARIQSAKPNSSPPTGYSPAPGLPPTIPPAQRYIIQPMRNTATR
jgi:hypothetical protein